ncbi:MAG: DUF5681 domain-containing protein [Terriglobales bacterium]
MQNKENQRAEPKQLGGITGRGFVPGQSGNPSGRPRTRGLVSALRTKMSEVGADGRSLEERLVGVLIQEALKGRQRLAAVAVIFDRLEGRAHQQIQIADVTKELREKSDDELRFHLAHDRWPDGDEILELASLRNEKTEE